MHPFTSLALWGVVACSALLMPAGLVLTTLSTTAFAALLLCRQTRKRARYVAWLLFSLGVGMWLVHGGWLVFWLSGQPRDPADWHRAVVLWQRILTVVSTAQLWMAYVPLRQFIRALFASRLPPGLAWLLSGPLLIVEQLKQRLASIHEAQRARGVPLDGRWYQRVRAIPALIVPLTHGALNDVAVRGAALDMRAFRLHRTRTTLWAPVDSPLQRSLRYAMLAFMLAETGVWLWLR
nr:energy-coupling factor transporter transmembrane component T [uncultured Enterobacter sp.]